VRRRQKARRRQENADGHDHHASNFFDQPLPNIPQR
jgi:hypothetical protein